MPSDISHKISSEPVDLRGIIIAVHPYSDKHLVVRLLVDTLGKISALAPNARNSKKRFTGIDLFERGTFRFARGRGSLAQIQAFVPDRPFEKLRTNLTALAIASLLAEASDHLCHEDSEEDGHVFEAFLGALERISSATSDREMLRYCYEALIERLAESGFMDPAQAPPPSRNALSRLMNHIEMVTERALKSKKSVEEELQRLKNN